MPTPNRPLRKRLYEKIRKVRRRLPTACWEWQGGRHKRGYGKMSLADKTKQVHRLMYEMEVGPIPKGLSVLHRCDNPPCINPTHFFLGTQGDNIRDKVAKGRQPKGERNVLSKLTNRKVRAIRAKYATGLFSQRELAEEFGIARRTVSHVVRRENWKEVL